MKHLTAIVAILLYGAAHAQDFLNCPRILQLNETIATATPVRNGTCEEAVCQVCVGNMCGSGTNIEPAGVVLTCAHVVGTQVGQQVTLTFPGRSAIIGNILIANAADDLALVGFDNSAAKIMAVPVANNKPAVGDRVWTVGYPKAQFTTRDAKAVEYAPLQTAYGMMTVLRSSAVCIPGDSGGAVIDANGRLVGVQKGYFKGDPQQYCLSIGVDYIDTLIGRRRNGTCPDGNCPGQQRFGQPQAPCPPPAPPIQPPPAPPVPQPNEDLEALKRQVNALTDQLNKLQLRHGKDGERGPIGPPGPKGPPGEPGKDANANDVKAIRDELEAVKKSLAAGGTIRVYIPAK